MGSQDWRTVDFEVLSLCSLLRRLKPGRLPLERQGLAVMGVRGSCRQSLGVGRPQSLGLDTCMLQGVCNR